MFNIFKRAKRDIMGKIVASNVHPYFLDCDYINGCRQITEGIFPKK